MFRCNLCPRGCNVDREKTLGFCKSSLLPKIARAELHLWEEPCISGKNGAGTVFFSGCNLSCVYCQNEEISHYNFGEEISLKRLREIFNELIEKGAENIELVTPSHFITQIKEALIPKLTVPVIYNTGGYDSVESLKLLDGLIDIYMPDMKYAFSSVSKKYSNAENYPEINEKAIEEMYRQVGDTEFDENGILKKGVLVRHLILPQNIVNTKAVIKKFAQLSKDRKMLFSLMAQFTPNGSGRSEKFPELNRTLSENEYRSAINYLNNFPQIEGFTQELTSSGEKYIPDFDLSGVKK